MAGRRHRVGNWFRSEIGRKKRDPDRQDNASGASSSTTVDSSTQRPTLGAPSVTINNNSQQQNTETSPVAVNNTVQNEATDGTSTTVGSNAPNGSKSLWDQAYDKLSPELVKDYESLLEKEEQAADNTANGESATKLGPGPQPATSGPDNLSGDARLKIVIDRGLKRMENKKTTYSIAGHEFDVQNQISQAAKFMLWAKGWIDTAVTASPEASLAWSGICLILPLFTNPTTASEANSDGFMTVTARMRYYVALEPMLLKLGNNPKISGALVSEATEHIVDLYKAILDFQISSVLRFFKPRLQVFVRDMVSSKDWKKAVLDIKELEKTVNGDFSQISDLASGQELRNLAKISEDSLATLQGFISVATKQLDVLNEQLRLQKEAVQHQITAAQKYCLQLFCLTEGKNKTTYHWYKDRVEERVEGTCNWFLNHENFERWLVQDSGPLLVSADPGCGKSVLAKYLINKVLPLYSATICYFFFKDQDQDTVSQALCALLHQLFSQNPALIQHAMKLFDSMGAALVQSEISLWKILESSLQDPGAGSVIIVLDALDECREAEFKSLVRNLQNIFSASITAHNKHRILMTSRPYEQIMNEFWELLEAFPYIRIPGEKKSQELSREINHVINHRVDQLSRKLRLPDNVEALLRNRLLQIEHRTYLWVYLVFDHLDLGFKKVEKGVEEALENLPQTINQSYDHILCRSKDDPSVRKALSIILAANRPLTLGEMNFAMTIRSPGQSLCDLKNELQGEEDFQQYLRSLCGLFVSVYHGKVYFIHQTAREFLLNSLPSSEPATNLGWQHSISIRQAHSALAEICVFHLDQFKSIEIKDSRNDLDERKKYLENYDLLYYAAVNWAKHLREARSHRTPDCTVEDLALNAACMSICDSDCIVENPALDAACISICGSKPQAHHVWRSIFYEEVFDIVVNDIFVDLLVAAYFCLDHLASLLLDKGADIEAKDENYQTPLIIATQKEHLSLIRLFLHKNADTESRSEDGRTSLMFSAAKGNETSTKLLLDRGACIEAGDEKCWTPLMFAAMNGHRHILSLLLDRGADIEARDSKDRTSLLIAATEGEEPSVRLLLERGADIEAKDQEGRTSLLLSITEEHKSCTILLLDRGASIEAKDNNGKTPLLYAASRSTLRLLLDRGADIKARDDTGWTALMSAAYMGNELNIKLLLDRGADIHAKDDLGLTSLLIATTERHESCIRLLLDRGADIEAKDNRGRTALMSAANNWDDSIIGLLLDRGADIETKSRDGWTPLILAARRGHEFSIGLLLDRGADIEAKDNEGRTALSHALDRGKVDVQQLLLERGAQSCIA